MGLATASFVCALIGASQWPFENFFWPFGRGWELLLGSCLAVFPGPKGRSRWHGPGAAAGVILILLACAFSDSGSGYPGARALVPTVGTALVLHCTSAGPNTTGRLLSLAPLRGIGVISYSLYLWHWPVLAFLRCTIASQLSGVHLAWAFAIMLLLGFLSWRFVEQPFRGMANGAEGRRKLLQGFVVASIGLALLAGTVRATRGLAARPWIREVVGSQGRERGANHAHEAPAQLPSDVASLPRLGACADPLHADFLLWGDSHAMALSSCLDRRARETGICGVAAIRAGRVPLLDPADTLRDRGVESWGADVLSLAASSGVRNLVLCAYWSSYFLRGTGLTDPAALAHADRLPWRMVLDTTLRRAVEAGMDVWILGEVPTQELTPGQALVRGWWSGTGLESVGVDSTSHASRAALLEEALEAWSRHPKVHIVQLGDACFGSNGFACMGNREMAYYFDRSHLSDDGAEHLLRQVLGDLCVSIRLRSSESTPNQ